MQWLFKTPGHDSLEIFSTKINARLKFEHSNLLFSHATDFQPIGDPKLFDDFFYFTGMSQVPTFQQRVELIGGAKIDFPGTVSKQFEEGLKPKTEKVEKRIDFGTFFVTDRRPEKQTRHCFGNVHFAVSWSFVLNWHLAEA